MSDTLDALKKWKNGIELISKVEQPTIWQLERIEECVNGLFSFSKFKVGDRVKMAATYPVNEKDSWGWLGIKHLLEAGSKATILKVDWYNKKFVYLIEFDERTYWNTQEKKALPSTDSTHISIGEQWLKAIK